MHRRAIQRRGLAALAFACLAVASVWAEVAVEPNGYNLNTIVMGIIEDPDPICRYWTPVRPLDPRFVLNPGGTDRGDGRPDIAFESAAAVPHVVWSYNAGTDHDVAYSQWTGQAWSGPEFLTFDLRDQLDPRIFLKEDGSGVDLQVVWWEPGPTPSVWWSYRAAGSTWWSVPERVTDVNEPGLRPSVAQHGGLVHVAYERPTETGTEIVVATRQMGGTYSKVVLVAIAEPDLHDPILHAHGGKVWLDWKGSATEFTYSVRESGIWRPPTPLPWTDFSWFGFEEAREVTERTVLSP